MTQVKIPKTSTKLEGTSTWKLMLSRIQTSMIICLKFRKNKVLKPCKILYQMKGPHEFRRARKMLLCK